MRWLSLCLICALLASCGEETAPPPSVTVLFDPYAPSTFPAVPVGMDVMDHLAKYTAKYTGKEPSSEQRFVDVWLGEVEEALARHRARPWTVARLVQWFREAPTDPPHPFLAGDPRASRLEDEMYRAALVYLLGVSRDLRGLAVVGPALSDKHLQVRRFATHAIEFYWSDNRPNQGGLQGSMMAALSWWDERGKALIKGPSPSKD